MPPTSRHAPTWKTVYRPESPLPGPRRRIRHRSAEGWLPQETEAGVGFWGAMYIPVVVAMAANQNVVAALKGGPVALLSAVGAVIVCACCIAVLSRTGRDSTSFANAPHLEEI